VAGGGGVDVLNTSHGEKLLRDERSNNTRSSGGRDQTETDRAALARDLARHGVGSTRDGTPIATADRDQVHLSVNDGTTDGSRNLLGTLKAKPDVAIAVTNSDIGFEAGALTGGGLLLHRGDLHHLVAESGAKKVVNNLVLLNGEGVQKDLLDRADLVVLDQAAELGNRDPLVSVTLITATTSAATTTAAVSTTTTKSTSFRGTRHY
jgi:hypothetical protein